MHKRNNLQSLKFKVTFNFMQDVKVNIIFICFQDLGCKPVRNSTISIKGPNGMSYQSVSYEIEAYYLNVHVVKLKLFLNIIRNFKLNFLRR